MTRCRNGSRRRSAGQALVEFALVAPVFFAILFGLVDGARLVFAYNTLSDAAREATRLAAVQASHIGETPCLAPICPGTTSAFVTNVTTRANLLTPVVGDVSSLYVTCTASNGSPPTGTWSAHNDCASSNTAGNTVSVRLVVSIHPITPVFSIPFPTITLAAASTMAIP